MIGRDHGYFEIQTDAIYRSRRYNYNVICAKLFIIIIIIICFILGLKLLWRIFAVTTGNREDCVRILKEGNLLAIAPGGTREAYFSGNTYPLMWFKRKGFAQVTKEAKVPIIPVFTQNCREAFRTPKLGRNILRWLYEKTRAPLVPIYGGFPVKLKTFIGPPIQWDPQMTVDDIVQKAHEAVEGLIQKHQKIPGSIRRAFLERFSTSKEKEE
nr:transmembrane protein 68-like [Lytechinus pictus]